MGLSKAEKMEIVSKAIDEGFDISLNFHEANSFEHAVSVLDVVIPKLKTDITCSNENECSWIQHHDYDSKLEVNAWFDRVEGEIND